MFESIMKGARKYAHLIPFMAATADDVISSYKRTLISLDQLKEVQANKILSYKERITQLEIQIKDQITELNKLKFEAQQEKLRVERIRTNIAQLIGE